MTKPSQADQTKSRQGACSGSSPSSAIEFQRRAEEPPVGFLGELLYMIKRDKQWWLVPILLTLVLLSALVFLGGTAAAPFIYTLF
jgi:hypothetical protein